MKTLISYSSQITSSQKLVFAAAVLLMLVLQSCSGSYAVAPDIADGQYGPFDQNSFDLWKTKNVDHAPLVIYFHGGGFSSGDKGNVSEKLVAELLQNGMSVMTVNYRLTPDAVFPEHHMDCARAIQYARYHAEEFNIDPARIAAAGSSAGASIGLWIGFHDDLADSSNTDPVLRMPTRLTSVAMFSGQTTLEPAVIREWFGDIAVQHIFFKGAFFGISPSDVNTRRGSELFRKASPVSYLTNDDPPVWMYYSTPNIPPVTVSEGVHHIRFGEYLKEKMTKAEIECVLLGEDTRSVNRQCAEFLKKRFRTDLQR